MTFSYQQPGICSLICRDFLDSRENPHFPHQSTETGTHDMLFSTPQARTRLLNTRTQIALLTPSQTPPELTEAAGEDTSDSGYGAQSRPRGRSGSQPSTRSL